MSLLDVADLDAGYGDLQVLHGVDLAVGDGEYVAIVGPNGAGKSTAMKAVVGLATHMGGAVQFDGESIAGLAPQSVIERGIGYVPQTENVFPTLTVEENLQIGAYRLGGLPDDRQAAVLDQFPILADRLEQRAGNLSGGQQQVLAMARALIPDPPLLLLDEPSAGLAPDLVDEMFDHIDAINDRGVSVLIVEQNAKTALERCDRGCVLAQGENRYVDDGAALLDDPAVRRQFLGG
ncbi:ABC-type branched-chain amino acid transport systems, ATPase component [Halovivax ruber XH-70]|uniref:ABC-type branched-chain amino acid transport systems, ATPase component n=1 Tax=Halovivax ruber (strain DSM 18193 / JCM 13892 / XH-70) TaxID=797302 RepID=L0I8I7_HALRX|nr:ABC transporter ATP-binding protein [Halovivax ruber]AGB15019.1 ABC-type branched-chain amino acid transport systems, ATPase component [Halovivax ruber XH-70]